MRRLLATPPVVVLLLGLISCNYPSKTQAYNACEKWRQGGEKISYKVNEEEYKSLIETADPWREIKLVEQSVRNRKCESESETNQFLGYEGKFDEEDRKKSGKQISRYESPKATDYNIVKHFRY